MIPSSQEGLAAFDQALLDACALMRPPESLTVAQWADRDAVLSAEGSSQPGKWYTSNAEYQREPMDVLTDPRYQTEVLMWASQLGKTQIGLHFTGYTIAQDPCPMLFVEPTEDLSKVIVKDRIRPMLRDTPALAGLVNSARGGGGDLFHMSFPGGQLSMGWANSPSQLASRPVGRLVTDEEGRYESNPEGDPVDQARKRLATYRSRMHLRISSPGLRRTCRITRAYEQSDQRRFFVPCPQCGHMQPLVWEQMKWPIVDGVAKADECYYVCEANGCAITDSDKYAMVRAGEWRAQNPGGGDGRTAGFKLSALYSTIGYSWPEVVADYLKCEGIPDRLHVFTNTVLAEPWDEEAEGADLNEVRKHAEDYAAQAPAGVLMVTCGADVQKDRIEATKWGYGLQEQSWALEHRIFRGDPEKSPEVWQEFEMWRRQPVQHELGVTVPVACTFVDSGDGNRTQAVYEFTRRMEAQRVFACKGSSLHGAPLVNRGNRVGRYKTLVVSVGTSTAKDVIYSRLQIADKSRPGYIHFPKDSNAGCDADYYKHLTAEVLVTRQTKGGEVSRWENPNKRNEALDCKVYADAAKEFTRANLRELARLLDLKVARLKASGQLLAPRAASPATASSPASPSPASSAASASPAKVVSTPQAFAGNVSTKRRKTYRRPGFGWIHNE